MNINMTDRIEQSVAKCLELVENNKYKLSVIVSKRANELLKGDDPLIDIGYDYYQNSDIAILEIAQGKLDLTRY
jgi:DNA-directed RNA polymerase subunit omega